MVDYSDMYLSVLNDCLECLMLEEGGDERIVKLLRGEAVNVVSRERSDTK